MTSIELAEPLFWNLEGVPVLTEALICEPCNNLSLSTAFVPYSTGTIRQFHPNAGSRTLHFEYRVIGDGTPGSAMYYGEHDTNFVTVSSTIIPEPSTALLVMTGIIGLASYRRGRARG